MSPRNTHTQHPQPNTHEDLNSHPRNLHKHINLGDMHHRPGRIVLMGNDGEGTPNGTGDPLSKNMDPSPFPPEISLHMIRRYLSAQPTQGEQWGLGFEATECIRQIDPPLELLTPINVLAWMMHARYMTIDTFLSSILSQWAEHIFVCQIKGNATVMPQP